MPDLAPLRGKSTFDNSQFRQGMREMLEDMRAVMDLSRQFKTINLTANLAGGKDVQRTTRAVRQAIEEMVPTDTQKRIAGLFNDFEVGAGAARQSAAAFEAQAAALRARLQQLDNAVRLTRSEFQSGFGEATPQEIAALTTRMNGLQAELRQVGDEAKLAFGEFSNEAVKAQNAVRMATATVAAATGQISRLGLASQVKLGASAALAQYGPQAGIAANSLIQFAKASEMARLSSVFFGKTLEKNNIDMSEARSQVDLLAGSFNVMPATVEATYKSLLRNGYTLQQATETMKLIAASGLAAGQDVGGAFNALSDDVMRGTTIMLNAYGVTANQATAWNQYAKSIGTTTDKLTGAQKAEAFLAQLRREASDELADAEAIMQGYGGSISQMNMELTRSQQELGSNFLPLILNGTRALVGFLNWFNEAPPVIRNTTTVLVGAAVAVGLLATPVASLVNLYRTLTTAQTASVVATGAATAAETGLTAATVRLNVATALKRVLLADVGVLWAKATTAAMLYQGSLGAAAVSTNAFTGALAGLKAAWAGLMATNIFTVGAVAVGALGIYWNKQVTELTATYEQLDKANDEAFNKTMARVSALRKQGTDLSRNQARVLLLQQQIAQEQQGTVTGTNIFTGERYYSKPDEARLAQLRADLHVTQEAVKRLHDMAEQRGQLNLVLTEDQTKAVRELNKALDGRQFDVKLSGMSDLQADLARLGQTYDELRRKFKEPFTTNGKLMDPAQTPALREGLARLDTQFAAEQANTRKEYTQKAAEAARQAAIDAQNSEIQAMQEGRAKRDAERAAELAAIKRDTAEKAKQYGDFPQQQAAIESAGRRQVVALRHQWAAEDIQAARDAAQRVSEADDAARAAEIAAIQDQTQRRQTERNDELSRLRDDIRKRVEALREYPRLQAEVEAAGQRQIAALRRLWAAQDQKEAKDRALRIVQAWQQAQQSEGEARVAATAAEAAQFELSLSRRLAKVKDNAVEVARIEQQAIAQRAQIEEQAIQRQYSNDRRNLQDARDNALSGDNLSAKEREAIWADYYSKLRTLDIEYSKGQAERLKKREEDDADAAERLRLARLAVSDQPLRDSEVRVRELERSRDLSMSDAETLRINQQLSRERSKQLQTLQAQLSGQADVVLTNEERRQKEEQVRELNHQQAVELQNQQAIMRDLVASTFDRLDAEAKYAEESARTEADRLAAQQRQLTNARARLADLDEQIAAEEREKERNDLIQQRFSLLGKIGELESRINNAPLEAESRRLKLYEAQARTELTLAGLADDKVAQANLTAQIAARELLLANRRVAAARTQLELEAALSDQAQARLAFAEALLARRQAGTPDAPDVLTAPDLPSAAQAVNYWERQAALQNRLQDAAEARARAMLQIQGLANDGVASAEQELRFARERLSVIQRQLKTTYDPQQRSDLVLQQIELIGQIAEQERKVNEAREARLRLNEQLTLAERALQAEAGNQAGLRRELTLTAAIGEARSKLAAAERDYAQARAAYNREASSANAERLKSATDALTGAIRGQREAVRNLADEYRQQISSMDSVQDAAERLRTVVYGDQRKLSGTDITRELDRYRAIETRRATAQQLLADALRGGDTAAISKATQELAVQEERYRKQAELLRKNGQRVELTGEDTTRRLADQVDALGIQYDRDAVALMEKARLTDQEAQTAVTISSAMTTFEDSTTELVKALEDAYTKLPSAIQRAVMLGSTSLPQVTQPSRQTGQQTTTTQVQPLGSSFANLDQAAANLLNDLPPALANALGNALSDAKGSGAGMPAPPQVNTPTTQPVTHITYAFGDIHVSAPPSLNPREIAQGVKRELQDEMRRSGRKC